MTEKKPPPNDEIIPAQIKTVSDFVIEDIDLQKRFERVKKENFKIIEEIKEILDVEDENQADKAAMHWIEMFKWDLSEDKELLGFRNAHAYSDLSNNNQELLKLIKDTYSSIENVSSEQTDHPTNNYFKDTLTFSDGSVGIVFNRKGSIEDDSLEFGSIKIMIPTKKVMETLSKIFSEHFSKSNS